MTERDAPPAVTDRHLGSFDLSVSVPAWAKAGEFAVKHIGQSPEHPFEEWQVIAPDGTHIGSVQVSSMSYEGALELTWTDAPRV